MQISTGELALASCVIILAMLILWIVPRRQTRSLRELTEQERFKIENEARKVIAEILGGAVVLMGLFFTWQTVKSTAENLRISEEGQITERFTRAIEQLGQADEEGKASNVAIRLGGIRGLERIAIDSERDYWPIMEILSAYVRQHAAWKEGGAPYSQDEVPRPDMDIQAILSVLGKRLRSQGDGKDQQLDLSLTDLRKAALNDANFKGANLSWARLDGARLQGIHLEGANLTNANLSRAVLHEAHLEGANLTGAILDNAVLTGANLKGVIGLTAEQIRSVEKNDKTQLP